MSEAVRRSGGQAVSRCLASAGPPATERRNVARKSFRVRLSAILFLLFTSTAVAQNNVPQQLEESRRRIDQIRREREQLQEERTRLQGQAHTLDQELSNIERQRETTNRIVNELESQIGGLNVQVDKVSANLALAEDNLAEKRAVLSRRLVDIYKRGPLYGFQVLLAAESFGDLLSRYKYLYLTSRQDRSLLQEVESLRDRVQRQRHEVVQMRSEFSRRREERETELQRYGTLANERAQRLRQVQRSTRSTEQRLSDLERDENRLNDLLASLERNRRAGEAGATGAGSLTTSDIGKLDWPVDGNILYPFGRATLPSGGVIRRNGIGIASAPGTPVKAVESGTVEFIQRLSTYGLTLGIQHGNGYRSLYMHLGETRIALGAAVTRGQVIATVGEATSNEGSHLYFEIRGENGIALDPADWLRRRR